MTCVGPYHSSSSPAPQICEFFCTRALQKVLRNPSQVPGSLVGENPMKVEYKGIWCLGFQDGERPGDAALSFNLVGILGR